MVDEWLKVGLDVEKTNDDWLKSGLDEPKVEPVEEVDVSAQVGELRKQLLAEQPQPSSLFGTHSLLPPVPVLPGQMEHLFRSGLIRKEGFALDDTGKVVEKDTGLVQEPAELPYEDFTIHSLATPFQWAAMPTPEAQNFTDFAIRVLPTSAAKLVPGVMRFFAYDLPKPFTDAIIGNLKKKWEIVTELPFEERQEATRLADVDMMQEVGSAIYEVTEGLARFSGEQLGLFGLEDFKRRWLSDPAGAVLGLVPFIRGAMKYKEPTLSEKYISELKNEDARMQLNRARNERMQEFNLTKDESVKKVRDDINKKKVAIKDLEEAFVKAGKEITHTFTSKKGNVYTKVNNVWFDNKGEKVTNQFVIKAAEKGKKITSKEVGQEFVSERTGEAFKTKASTATRKKQLEKEGIETEPIKTEEGWKLKSKEEPKPVEVVEKPKPIDKELPAREAIEAGTVDPKNSPFFENAEVTEIQKKIYEDSSRQTALRNDPELYTMKLVNDVNRWFHGEQVDIANVKKQLNGMSVKAPQMRDWFDDPSLHRSFVEFVEEADVWAQQLRRPGERTISTGERGVTLKTGVDPTEILKEWDGLFKGLRDAKKVPLKDKLKKTDEMFRRKFIDPSANIKVNLIKTFKDEGAKVVAQKILERGANARAAMMYRQARKAIYSKLNKADQQLLDAIIFARRVIQIDDIHGEGIKAHPGGKGGKFHSDALEALRVKDPAKFETLMQRTDIYFETMRDQLKQLFDEGLLPEADYNNLRNFDYSRRQLIDILDPEIGKEFQIGRTGLSVRDSGVQELTKGRSSDLLETDSNLLMMEVINRTQGRIMKNRANKTLFDLAEKSTDNPFVRVGKKPGKDWRTLNLFVDGEKTKLHMQKDFAREWVATDVEMSYNMSNFMRVMSGSVILRPMATGINVGFAFANLPRDLAHIWLTSQIYRNGKWESTYSPVLPVSMGQMGRDLATVLPDALTRKGRFEDYINEGGGMEFLVHQGRLLKKRLGSETGLDKVQDVLGYINETSEIISRLALRERVIRKEARSKGITIEQAKRNSNITTKATAAARDYMDFNQGGGFGKAIDTAIPYLNASIQGTRGLFRSAIRQPGTFGIKSIQLAGLVTGLYFANKFNNPEALKSVSEEVQKSNFIFTTPINFLDNKGQKRYLYFALPKDPSQKFMSQFFEYAARKVSGEELDADQVVSTLKELSPVTDTNLLPPSVQSLLGYSLNKDFWRREDIWKKGKVEPVEEHIPGQTGTFFKDLGQAVGMSPERLQYALQRLFTSGNLYSHMAGWGYDKLFDELPESEREQHIAMVLARTPVTRRFVKVTNPLNQFREVIDDTQIDVGTKRWINTRELDRLAEGYLFHDNVERKEIKKFILGVTKKDGKAEGERLFKRLEFQNKIKGLGNRNFWLILQRMAPEARAKVFKERWDNSNPTQKKEMKKEIRVIGERVFSEEFFNQLGRLTK